MITFFIHSFYFLVWLFFWKATFFFILSNMINLNYFAGLMGVSRKKLTWKFWMSTLYWYVGSCSSFTLIRRKIWWESHKAPAVTAENSRRFLTFARFPAWRPRATAAPRSAAWAGRRSGTSGLPAGDSTGEQSRQVSSALVRALHRAYLHADAVIHTQPEEQQRTQEQSLEERVQRSRKPAVEQERQREERIYNTAHQTPVLGKVTVKHKHALQYYTTP